MFVVLLVGLPLLKGLTDNGWVAMVDSFYRAGSLVFGGGHVVLPLLENETVLNGWMSKEDFLTGYGATQAVPGPLFTFAAYLGVLIQGFLEVSWLHWLSFAWISAYRRGHAFLEQHPQKP